MTGRSLNLWTETEDAKLAELRACGVKWPQMPRHMPGRTIQACQQRILYLKAKAEGKRKGCSGGARRQAIKLKAKEATAGQRDKIARLALAYAVAQAEILAAEQRSAERRAAASAAPPSARRLSTHVLIADSELRSRLALQGLTAGLLGDPLPGRSALDERNAQKAGA